MILDELTLYIKELLLNQSSKLSAITIERFFRVIADSKALLAIGSDGEFVLTLALFKMIEALEIKDIDMMIKSLGKELQGVEVTEILVTTPDQDKNVPNEIITITQDEIIATLPKQEPKVEVEPEVIISIPTIEKDIVEPIPEPIVQNIEPSSTQFDSLLEKIYDRNYDLGECFKRNIEFQSFEDAKLTWSSIAEEDDKKQLRTHWGLINMFVKEIFGLETKIVNIAKKKPEKSIETVETKSNTANINDLPIDTTHNDADSSSMIEDIEMKSSCIAPEAGETEAAKEKDPSTLLHEPMIKEAIALFDPKKVRIKRNT